MLCYSNTQNGISYLTMQWAFKIVVSNNCGGGDISVTTNFLQYKTEILNFQAPTLNPEL